MPAPIYFDPAPSDSRTLTADLCIYGGVSGGVIAAVEAAKRGLEVILLESSAHLGGMSASGLGMTDAGNKHVVGGLSREFYKRVGSHYGLAEEWRFEPHVAEQVFEDWLKESPRITVLKRQFVKSISMQDHRIRELRTVSGLTVRARMFIDASYEGDLMALAGVSYTIGRESNSVYGETINGQQIHTQHQFLEPVDPYVVPGVPSSGLLPGVEEGVYRQGQGDHRVQTYNFRMCLTRREDIRIPFPKPADYDPAWYLLLKRHLATGWNEAFRKFDEIRNGKTDTNNHGAVSTDFIGMNHSYPAADYAGREKIYRAHVTWQQGLMWCMANDPEIPAAIREPMREWGLCRDEFQDSGGWPHALYIRESRRMVSDYVMNECNCRGAVIAQDPCGLAAYAMDSHNCRRIVVDGHVQNEGDVQAGDFRPYPISYRSIVPKKSECTNLMVVYCISASHISFGSIRMEPVLMVLGQSSAIAAAVALEENIPIQDAYSAGLCRELESAGQIVNCPEKVEMFKVGKTEVEALAEA